MNWELMIKWMPRLLEGAWLTLELVAIAVLAGLILAIPLGIARSAQQAWVRALPYAYIFFFRGTPLLVQLFLVYYGLAQFEAVRQSALAMFHTLEQWVVDNGFLEVVAIRNRFARAMGYRDYFDYKVRKNEQMSPEQLFAVLDDFIARTEQRVHQSLAELKAAKGEAALLPHNLRYSVSGDVTRQLDPYVPFSRALKDWVQSFRRLGIQYRGATLTLDLLTREGKYENGFCHGPIPAYVDAAGRWVAGQINFTAEAKPYIHIVSAGLTYRWDNPTEAIPVRPVVRKN